MWGQQSVWFTLPFPPPTPLVWFTEPHDIGVLTLRANLSGSIAYTLGTMEFRLGFSFFPLPLFPPSPLPPFSLLVRGRRIHCFGPRFDPSEKANHNAPHPFPTLPFPPSP